MLFRGVQNQAQIFQKWSNLINAKNDIQDETLKMSTAIVLENAQSLVDHQYQMRSGRGLLFEAAAGVDQGAYLGAGDGGFYSDTVRGTEASTGDARVPSIVIPMIRRIYPNLIAHKLVGVQPMQGPIGMAFAFRPTYNRFGRGGDDGAQIGDEIGYLNVDAAFSGKKQYQNKFNNVPYESNPENPASGYVIPNQDQGALEMRVSGGVIGTPAPVANDPQSAESAAFKAFFGGEAGGVADFNGAKIYGNVGDGADTSDAENWAVGRDMPEAGFEILKATVTAKTRKLGVKITRETEEDMKAMQGLNAQQEVSDLLSYEISQEIDRQLLGEIVQAAVRAGNVKIWNPANVMGLNQHDRVNNLYTTVLAESAKIATKSRRGAANWAVASPTAAALLESNIYNPLGVGGGLGNANAFGKSIDNGIGVTEIGSLRNGTIKLYRDTLAGGDYILLGFKGNNVYDAGIIYLPYIPLELMQAQDPFSFNPITAARTRYGVTTNLFGAGQFYSMIALQGLTADITGNTAGKFMV